MLSISLLVHAQCIQRVASRETRADRGRRNHAVGAFAHRSKTSQCYQGSVLKGLLLDTL